MKRFLGVLTIVLIGIGFVNQSAWVFALITGIIAIGLPPPGRRADGKRRTGGLLGGLWDDFAVRRAMRDCPFCKTLIRKDAQKCPHCSEWVS
jgi:hypothetical protein